MKKRLFKFLSFITPRFLYRLDRHLVARHPLIWSTRLHYVLFYTVTALVCFEVIIRLIPSYPTTVFVPLYIAYFSVLFGVCGLGVWVYSQSRYNISRSYGLSKPFFQQRNVLIFVLTVFLFVSCAIFPIWTASIKAYDYTIGHDIKQQVNQMSAPADSENLIRRLRSLPNRSEIDHMHLKIQEERNYADIRLKKLKDNLVVARQDKEQRRSLAENISSVKLMIDDYQNTLDNRHDRLAIFHKFFFTYLNYSKNDVFEKTGVIINHQGNAYTELKMTSATSDATRGYYYKDRYGNLYRYDLFIEWLIVDRLAKNLIGNNFTSILDVLYGNLKIDKTDITRILKSTADLKEAPFLFDIAELSERDVDEVIVILEIFFICVLAVMILAATANFFSVRRVAIDTFIAALYFIMLVVIFSIVDQVSKTYSDIEIFTFLILFVFLKSLLAYVYLNKAHRYRPFQSFLWLMSCIALPTTLVLAYFLLREEYGSYASETEIAITITSAIIFCVLVYFPSQIRLLYKVYALPR